ncbi:MAG: class I SAM-dependent methyltransferase [Phycisphaerae bacterium]|nr:class I SAM-dependent methyltransferase [Phycisphaerales bacterium]
MSTSTQTSESLTAFWRAEYERKAAHDSPIVQSGRGCKYDAQELRNEISRALSLLQIDRSHTVLDVGCANGLFGNAISACCKEYVGIEPVEALAELARRNLAEFENAKILTTSGDDVRLPSGSVDRVLIAEVIQLNPPAAVHRMLQELARVLRKPGRIVVFSVPDREKQAAFESDYTEQIRRADHLSDGEKTAILNRQANAHWYAADELVAWANELGGSARVERLPESAPNCDHRFDLVIDF